MGESKKPINTEKPEEIIDEIGSLLDDLQKMHIDRAIDAGYTRDVIRSVRSRIEKLSNSSSSDPTALRIYRSLIDQLYAFRDEVKARKEMITPYPGIFVPLSGSASVIVSGTASTGSFFSEVTPIPFSQNTLPFLSPDRHSEYSERFSRFDPALGKTYKEIWEAYYGTSADPERSALFLIRQAYDHLFAKLAPDDEVRKSSYWSPKKEKGKEQNIWRPERINYAAEKHIKDPFRRNSLIASTTHMLEVYEGLNSAHDRGDLNRLKAQNALFEMRGILEEWADAVGI